MNNKINDEDLILLINRIFDYYENDLVDMQNGLNSACFPILITFFSLSEFIARFYITNTNQYNVLFRPIKERILYNINEKYKNDEIQNYLNNIGDVRNTLTHNGFAFGLIDTAMEEELRSKHLTSVNNLLFLHPKELIIDSIKMINYVKEEIRNNKEYYRSVLDNFTITLEKRKIENIPVLQILEDVKNKKLNNQFTGGDSTSVKNLKFNTGIDYVTILGSYDTGNLFKDNKDKPKE